MDSAAQRLARARELCYLDPAAAGEVGHELVAHGGEWAGHGWLHVALAEVRVGDARLAADALDRARAAFETQGHQPGLALCGEVQAIALRRQGDYAAAAALQAQLDERDDAERDALHRFIAHNSRAITDKLLGNSDEALRHFYAAKHWAARTGLPGPSITALSNLGGFHQDL